MTTSLTRRALSLGAAAGLASIGLVAVTTPAFAADANSKVWVCKYVRTPGGQEVLKSGKNPIEVNGHSVDKDKDGQVFVGDQFADGQELSVIVQIEGNDPGPGICAPTPPVTPENPNTPGTPGTPGTGAPGTGGEDSGMPLGLLGGGALLVGAGVLAAEARRRRGTAGS